MLPRLERVGGLSGGEARNGNRAPTLLPEYVRQIGRIAAEQLPGGIETSQILTPPVFIRVKALAISQ